ncbi:hypothetical protein F5Y17DRAFT_433463 [Xylariaceae sp. FL0594]|nr:hypothetical protein F5Y17DRAFT_433463 [Xylariaceae sp. FL0594]
MNKTGISTAWHEHAHYTTLLIVIWGAKAASDQTIFPSSSIQSPVLFGGCRGGSYRAASTSQSREPPSLALPPPSFFLSSVGLSSFFGGLAGGLVFLLSGIFVAYHVS